MSREIMPILRISQAIRLLRGKKVLLDFDLAALYDVPTKALNQAVKRNAARFPEDFMFQLSAEEARSLRSQFVTLNRGQHLKYRPYAFTEQGVAMLSSVRETLETNRELAHKFTELEKRVGKHDEQVDAILEAIRQLMAPPTKPRREIGFHVRERAPRYRMRQRQ
jgi:hypothetical protein